MSREWFESNRNRFLKQMDNQCCNCGSKDYLEVHHIVPLSLGGTNRLSNLVVLCAGCHGRSHGHDKGLQRRLAQARGIARARAAGKPLGRSKEIDDVSVYQWRTKNSASISETAEHFGISTASVKRACKSLA